MVLWWLFIKGAGGELLNVVRTWPSNLTLGVLFVVVFVFYDVAWYGENRNENQGFSVTL